MGEVWEVIKGKQVTGMRRVSDTKIQIRFGKDIVVTLETVWHDYENNTLGCRVEDSEWTFSEVGNV